MILFQLPTETSHLCITFVGGNRVIDVPTIPDLHLLGESCIFKHRIPGECSSVASTIQLGTPKFDNSSIITTLGFDVQYTNINPNTDVSS